MQEVIPDKKDLRRMITNPMEIKHRMNEGIIEAIRDKFPMEAGNNIATISNMYIKESELSHNQQKALLLSKGNASEGLYADITIKDKSTGAIVGELKKHRIMSIPVYTNRFTFLVDGNEYNVVNQLRTKSGCYTRKRGNDTLESSFNLSKGANFKLLMDPATGKFTVDILHATLPMYAVLRILGADDAVIKNKLGVDLFKVNSAISSTQMDRTLNTLYSKLVSYRAGVSETSSKAEKQQKIQEYFSGTEISPETTELTLGKAYTKVNYEIILDAALKILRVFNQEDDIDERDNLEFQKIHGVEDIIKEVVHKSTGDIFKLKSKLASFKPGDDPSKIFSPIYFTKPLRNFITTSSISRIPTQINPMEIIDGATIVTKLGEGAITSERAVPEETRYVSPSYVGIIDAVATPESSHVGVDNRFTIAAIKGKDNELYRDLIDAKTGKQAFRRVIDTVNKYIGIPDALYVKKKSPDDIVTALYGGKFVKVKRSQLDYEIPSPHMMHTMTTNSIPFMSSSQGNRLLMGAKHVQQAMPLKYRDERLVTAPMNSWRDIGSVQDVVGKMLLPTAPCDGVVTKIDDDYIYIKDSDKEIHKVDYGNNLPLATKTMLHNEIKVKEGDIVEKGDYLADSNFTKNGVLALGKNLNVAYIPYKGLNHEDGIVISESAARKLTSVHTEKISLNIDKLKIVDKKKFASAFPTEFTKTQLAKISDDGVVKKGSVLEAGDPIILILEDEAASKKNQVLGLVHKSLIRRFSNVSTVYDGIHPATVLDVFNNGSVITVLLKEEKPAVVGDKLSGSWGNKGVITTILPDDEMMVGENGKPLDALFTPVGVIGRINPAQLLDVTLSKIADKTGKPYQIENFSIPSNIEFVKNEMKKHGVSDTETVTDPVTGKSVPGVFTGVHHTYKLFKTTDTNFAARGIEGPHDQDDAPSGSGEIGPKALGGMEVNALIGHNARSILKEGSMLRSNKNLEYWKQFQYGGIPYLPKEKKTFTKFLTILKQAGVKTEREGDELKIGPLTDKDVKEMSSGEITDGTRLNYKLEPERGGLFDPVITGGLNGTRWGHVKLAEPVVNPVFESCVQSLLGGTKKSVGDTLVAEGGDALKKTLNAIDINKEIKETEENLENPKFKGDTLNAQVKKLKYLNALKATGLKAGDAYMLSYIPVVPPVVRPIIISSTGDTVGGDSNLLYKDLILQNNAFKKAKDAQLDYLIPESREALYKRVKELTGVMAPESPMLKNRGVKGAIQFIAGDTPKRGFAQRKVIYSKMNLSGRATISPDNTLGLDELGMPVDMAWSLYKPFIIRKLVGTGKTILQARDAVENRTAEATAILEGEMKERPVLINRAPTLWRNSIHAAYPKIRNGKTLLVNTMWESSTNSDFDGDSHLNSITYRFSEGHRSQHLKESTSKKNHNHSNFFLDNSKNLYYSKIIKDGNGSIENNFIYIGEQSMFENCQIRYSRGLVNLENFPRIEESKKVVGNVEKYQVPQDIEVLTVDNGKEVWAKVEEYSIHHNLKMVECRTSSGRTVHCSEDHSLMTVDENLNYVAAPPSLGLSVPRITYPLTEASISTIKIQNFPGSKFQLREDLNLDYDFGWLNGAFCSEGWADSCGNLYFANTDSGFKNKIVEICNSYIVNDSELQLRVRQNPHEYQGFQCYSEKVYVGIKALYTYFKSYIGHGAANKCLPSFWMETPIEFRKGLLAGLLDGDGTISETKAKSKKKSQWVVMYTTISRQLACEIVALSNSLGLTATMGFSKITEAGNTSWYINFTMESILKLKNEFTFYHVEKAARFSRAEPSVDKVNQKKYTPRISNDRLMELNSYMQYKTLKKLVPDSVGDGDNFNLVSIRAIIKKVIDNNITLSLETAKNIVKYLYFYPEVLKSTFWSKWIAMVEDPNIEWDLITEIKPLPHITTAYDITVPPAYTMVTESNLIVRDTETVHVPVSAAAVEDAKKMLPSKLVFSDKKIDTLLMVPKGEVMGGLYKATENLGEVKNKTVHKFKTDDEAWKAYYTGAIHAQDLVEIG